MSSSACAYLVAGVPVRSVLRWEIKELERDRFDPDTGEKSILRYNQVIYTVCGCEVPFKRKEVLSEFGCRSSNDRFRNSYNIRQEFLDWTLRNGFTGEFLGTPYHTVTNHEAPDGILGVSVWRLDPQDPTDYGRSFTGTPTPIDPKDTEKALMVAKKRLLAIGCEIDPQVYVLAKVC